MLATVLVAPFEARPLDFTGTSMVSPVFAGSAAGNIDQPPSVSVFTFGTGMLVPELARKVAVTVRAFRQAASFGPS